MPTTISGESHEARQVAESFGADADRYDRARPRYPDALVEAIVAASPGNTVLDVGCGTGIAARQFEAAGCTVVGVDVDARMARLARRHGIVVEIAKFEDWDPAGQLFDAVVSAQSWHWIDPVAGAAKAAEVLRPGGRLAAFWNTDGPPAELVDAFGAVYRTVMPDALAARRWTAPSAALDGCMTLCAKVADALHEVGGYGEPEHWRFDWERSYTRDEWLDQVPTTGDHGQYPPAQLDELLAGIGAAIDAAGGSFISRYTTVAVTAAWAGAD